MTAKAKFYAQEKRLELFAAADWKSVVSGEPLQSGVPQLAHRVARTRGALDKWGSEVVDHPLNLVPVRNLRENDFVNIGFDRQQCHALMERIIRITTGRESEPDMTEEYKLLREEFAERWKP